MSFSYQLSKSTLEKEKKGREYGSLFKLMYFLGGGDT